MSDRWAVALAVAGWVGATIAAPVPAAVVGIAGVGALVARHPAPACLALAVATSMLGARALDGLDPPAEGPFHGVLTLATDPEPTLDGGLRFEVVTSEGRLLAEVDSPTATEGLRRVLAGHRARVTGQASPFGRTTEWTRSRHLAGRLRIESVAAVGPGAPPYELANRFRAVLDRGAASLPARHRALLAGLVLGDDRAQPPELTADFRAAGLTHLLAVSGQNVMLTLVIASPFLRRLRLWPRYVASTSVVVAFALLTRFEPSVVRATFVAAVALFARTTGRPSGGLRHLAVAVAGLLLVDPMLVHSLGFRLSVAASVGVLVVAPPLVARLPGPRWFRDALGVTAGAQLAVAPVLVPALGPMPLAALPANVLAGPLAGALMAWGLTAGSMAGLVGGPAAALLHLPTSVGLAALEGVAAVGASLPLGRFDLRHVVVVSLAAVVARRGARRPSVPSAALAVALVAVAVAGPVMAPVPSGARPAGPGATVWIDGPVAVVDLGPRADPTDVLDALRAGHVAAVGLVVVRTARPSVHAVLRAIESRFTVGAVIAPPGVDHEGTVVPPPGFRARVGRFLVVVDRPGPPMRVRVGWIR